MIRDDKEFAKLAAASLLFEALPSGRESFGYFEEGGERYVRIVGYKVKRHYSFETHEEFDFRVHGTYLNTLRKSGVLKDIRFEAWVGTSPGITVEYANKLAKGIEGVKVNPFIRHEANLIGTDHWLCGIDLHNTESLSWIYKHQEELEVRRTTKGPIPGSSHRTVDIRRLKDKETGDNFKLIGDLDQRPELFLKMLGGGHTQRHLNSVGADWVSTELRDALRNTEHAVQQCSTVEDLKEDILEKREALLVLIAESERSLGVVKAALKDVNDFSEKGLADRIQVEAVGLVSHRDERVRKFAQKVLGE
jgi:hypothetical protein